MEGRTFNNLYLEEFAKGDLVYGTESQSIVKVFKNVAMKRTKKLTNQYDILTEYKKINFPNVLKIDKIIDFGNCFFMEMEKLIKINTEFDCYEEAVQFLRDCITGLADLQRINVAHNDIKIENIMKNEMGVFKIIDLDYCTVSKLKGDPFFTNFRSDIFSGTPGYYSPERILQNQCKMNKIDKVNAYKSDVYSLGITFLVRLFKTFHKTGCILPLSNQDIQQIMNNLLGNYSNFEKLIRKMVEDDVNLRYDPLGLFYSFNKKFKTIKSFEYRCYVCNTQNLSEKDMHLIENRGVCCWKCISDVHYRFEP